MAGEHDERVYVVPWHIIEWMVWQTAHPWRDRDARRLLNRLRASTHREFTPEIMREIRDLGRKHRGESRRHIPMHVRRLVMKRDGGVCRACGTTDHPTLDHVVPFSKGGTHRPENLQVLCRSCNSKKQAMSQDEWERRCADGG